MKANDEKLNLNLRLSLVSSVSWVTVPDHLVLMNTGLFKTSSVLFTFAINYRKFTKQNYRQEIRMQRF